MEPEELQNAWRSQHIHPVAVDAETLLALVKRNRRDFRSMILRRDAVEIGTALALTAFFAVCGIALSGWSWFVIAAACLFMAAFMLVDRRRQRKRSPSSAETLAAWVERARSDVEHQIWLLRNVFWWYLLPPLIGLICVYGQQIWRARSFDAYFPVVTIIYLGMLACSCAVLYWVYRLNQRAVRKDLQPRLDELRELAESLDPEPADEP